ncbi:MAG: ribonuclease H family protein [Veillonella sp.]|uniref:ribonuclease H1 domain-containing protein n=1 Tax=Veillonella sp. TaxID=1926307 RepID=UPI0025F84631|nr:viroplasmin family protein [Veillonella sp.]MBS4913734.1 ribonuclease H family protein [Veillonella sp.]
MAKKYYAVQQGRKPGIYETWASCEAQVKGFSGAVYKSFPTLDEAKAFMGDASTSTTANSGSQSTSGSPSKAGSKASTGETRGSLADYFSGAVSGGNNKGTQSTSNASGVPGSFETSGASGNVDGLVAYIDGSFDKHNGKVGSGGVIFYENNTWEFSFGTADPFYTTYWNVAGELLGAMHVMKEAKRVGAETVHLYYDYMGIEMWATGRWKTNNPLTQSYAQFFKEYRPYMKVHFHKVAAHTGVTYNERADQLAKAGTKK